MLAQTPPLSWGKRLGGAGYAEIQAMVPDHSGNVYYLGYYSQTVDFDPGPGITTLTCQSFADIFVSKLDSAGNFIWVKSFPGTGFNFALDIDYSPDGAICIGGYFTQGVIDLDPSAGTYTVNSASGNISFLVKLDLNGNFNWAKTWGPSNIQMHTTHVDQSGNIYLGGLCWNQPDFDPGPGTQTLSASIIAGDFFVLKLDISGQYTWARIFSYQSGLHMATMNAIEVDSQGNVYSTGGFQGTFDFDPGQSTHTVVSSSAFTSTTNLTDMFIHKLDSSGQFVWVNIYGNGQRAFGKDMKVDRHDGISIVGYFSGILDLDTGPGTTTVSSSSNTRLLLMHLNPAGLLTWGRATGGSVFPSPEGKNLAVDMDKNIYVTGFFNLTANLDPGSSNFTVTAPTNAVHAFIAKYDSTGQFHWGGAIGGDNFERGSAVCVGLQGSIYFGGVLTSSLVDIDPGAGTFTVSADTSTNSLYLIKLQQLCSQSIAISGGSSIYCDQDPITIIASGPGNISWYTTSTVAIATGTLFSPGTLPVGTHNYTLISENPTCWQPQSVISVTVDACTSTTRFDYKNDLTAVFPNPCNGKLILCSAAFGLSKKIVVHNIEGKQMLELPFLTNEIEINLEPFAAGVYLISIAESNEPAKKIKVIKL